ncbi:MAG: WYL domain-containing protein, partial [Bacteroidetes bacterium]|nr:WYL domain-containing protein [Bacteroidota bacterium]
NPLHVSQKIIKEGKKSVRFALEVNTNEELIQQLLGCCNAVRVIKPRKLQERMQEEIAKAAALYSEK